MYFKLFYSYPLLLCNLLEKDQIFEKVWMKHDDWFYGAIDFI